MDIKCHSNLAFQAKLSSKMRQELQRQAIKEGGQKVLSLCKKVKEVNSWGHKGSILKLVNDEFGNVKFIELSDMSFKNQSLLIKLNKSLLDFFMDMNKNSFIEKEMELRNLLNKKFVYK